MFDQENRGDDQHNQVLHPCKSARERERERKKKKQREKDREIEREEDRKKERSWDKNKKDLQPPPPITSNYSTLCQVVQDFIN